MNTARIKLFGAIYFAIEVIIFVLIGLVIGFGWAILLILAPIVIGGYLLKSHAQALLQAQRTSNVGMSAMLPALSMLGKMGQIIIGILLVIPGFLTTIVAGLMMITPLRKWAINFFMMKVLSKALFKGAHPSFKQRPANDQTTKESIDGEVIEGEFKKD